MSKLEEARLPPEAAEPSHSDLAVAEPPPERPRSSAQKSVHFDQSEPEIIPAREDDGESEPEPEPEPTPYHDSDGERAVVLYTFTADGEDEMTVEEGETLFVLERDTDEWWKCRNAQGDEGVVPANYLEVSLQTVAMPRLSLRRIFVACTWYWRIGAQQSSRQTG